METTHAEPHPAATHEQSPHAPEQRLADTRSETQHVSTQEMEKRDVEGDKRTSTSSLWSSRGQAARAALFRLVQASKITHRDELALSRTELAAWERRLEPKAVRSTLALALMLVPVVAVVSLLILLLQQVMPAWRAAFTTSAVMAVIGLSLLQKDVIIARVAAVRGRSAVPR